MSDLHNPTGPDPEFFKNLKNQLPSMKEALEKKRVFRGQVPVSEMVPKKCCRVCGRGFEWTTIQGPLPEVALCKRCDEKLKEGYIALISDNRFAFIKSESLKDKAGEVMEISPEVMEQVQKHYLAEWVEKMEETKPKPNEPTDTAGQGQDQKLN